MLSGGLSSRASKARVPAPVKGSYSAPTTLGTPHPAHPPTPKGPRHPGSTRVQRGPLDAHHAWWGSACFVVAALVGSSR